VKHINNIIVIVCVCRSIDHSLHKLAPKLKSHFVNNSPNECTTFVPQLFYKRFMLGHFHETASIRFNSFNRTYRDTFIRHEA